MEEKAFSAMRIRPDEVYMPMPDGDYRCVFDAIDERLAQVRADVGIYHEVIQAWMTAYEEASRELSDLMDEPDWNADWVESYGKASRLTDGVLASIGADNHSRQLVMAAWRDLFGAVQGHIKYAADSVAKLSREIDELRTPKDGRVAIQLAPRKSDTGWIRIYNNTYQTVSDALGDLQADVATDRRVLREMGILEEAVRNRIADLEADVESMRGSLLTMTNRYWRVLDMKPEDEPADADAAAWLPEGDLVESVDCDGNPILVDVRGIGVADAGVG